MTTGAEFRASVLPFTLRREGGFSVDRLDPGNWTGGKVGAGALKGTKFGIAASAHPTLDIAKLTLAQASDIYWREYVLAPGFDRLSAPLLLVVFDAGVNCGPGRAARWLTAASAKAGLTVQIAAITALNLAYHRSLSTWPPLRQRLGRPHRRLPAAGPQACRPAAARGRQGSSAAPSRQSPAVRHDGPTESPYHEDPRAPRASPRPIRRIDRAGGRRRLRAAGLGRRRILRRSGADRRRRMARQHHRPGLEALPRPGRPRASSRPTSMRSCRRPSATARRRPRPTSATRTCTPTSTAGSPPTRPSTPCRTRRN